MRATFLLILALLTACGGNDDPRPSKDPAVSWCGDGTVDDAEECDDGAESAGCNDDCTLAVCGDGKVNPEAGEQCDDSGESAACDADCTVAWCGDGTANASAGEACDASGESADCNIDCTLATCGDGVLNPTAGEACDHVGESAICNIDCTFSQCGDGVANAAAGEGCDDAGTSATCDGDCTVAECGDADVNPFAGEDCDAGGETVDCDADCTLVTCGDGTANATAGEACDDAGDSATCDADCTVAECGDLTVNAAAGEDCDIGAETDLCDGDCTEVVCGDGYRNGAAGEACDDAGDSPTCDADCTPATCGDGTVNAAAGEDCDEGQTAFCDADCTVAVCGDGVFNPDAGEECDDGGPTEACRADCMTPICGDGNVDVGEDCDDMGESATCNADCTAAECGDGVWNPTAGEACDDGRMGDCDVYCQPCDQNVVFEEDFSDNSAGWTLDLGWQSASWEIGSAMASTGHNPACGNGDPSTDHTPTGDNGVAGVDIGGNVNPAQITDWLYITSPPVSVTGPAELQFWRWLNSDYTPYGNNRVQVYDGNAWVTLWTSGPAPGVEDDSWTPLEYDLTPYANAALQVRFGYEIGGAGGFTCSGWNLDDVSILEGACDPADTPVRIHDQILANAVENTPYTEGLTVSGGSGSGTWSIVGGTNHTWLSIDPAGGLSGTPGIGEVGPVSVMVQFEEALNPLDNVHVLTFDFEVLGDSDGDGVLDIDDLCPGADDLLDVDTDGVPDGCDVCPGTDDADATVGYLDADGDGYGDLLDPGAFFCTLPPTHSELATDCDDSDPYAYPDALETDGDGVDSNCDGEDGVASGFFEDFDSGTMDPAFLLYTPPLRDTWYESTNESWSGAYSAQSAFIYDNEATSMQLTLDFPSGGELSFWHRGSTEANYDFLEFAVDGVVVDSWSGTWSWTESIHPMSAGTHTFEWTYTKDFAGSIGQDAVWVDSIHTLGGNL